MMTLQKNRIDRFFCSPCFCIVAGLERHNTEGIIQSLFLAIGSFPFVDLIGDTEIVLRMVREKAVHLGGSHDRIHHHAVRHIASKEAIVVILVEGDELRGSRDRLDKPAKRGIHTNSENWRGDWARYCNERHNEQEQEKDDFHEGPTMME